ncbi:MAG: hypothetical protein J6B28_02730 [Eubacterium sp.]|nr:hypothetical protein [Eubacterium sp.]
MGAKDFFYDLGRQVTGNIPKAILCVPDPKKIGTLSVEDMIKKSDDLRDSLLSKMSADGSSVMQTFRTLTQGAENSIVHKNGYLALEVPYNPSSIYMETVAGSQKNFRATSMGDAGNNQLRQNTEPVATTLSVQLLFDAVNAQDSFMISNVAPTIGNAAGVATDLIKSKVNDYSVKDEMDGIMALLTMPVTRHVIFFWAKMCFQGELTSVNSNYKMFNTRGNPVRGEIQISIRQSEDPTAKYENKYWEKAFTKAFGASAVASTTKGASTASKITSNSILNLNI